MLHTYHFKLQKSKIGPSGTQSLHGKVNLNLPNYTLAERKTYCGKYLCPIMLQVYAERGGPIQTH